MPTLGADEIAAVQAAIRSGFAGYGPSAHQLEKRFCELTGRPYAFAVSSGFQALALALRALDLSRPSTVSIPVLTCGSVLAAVTTAGHEAWLADTLEHDLTMDLTDLCPNTAALVVPRPYGAPLNLKAIGAIGLPWIEDCATSPAFASEASSTFAVFSFASTKYLTGGAGGMIVTRAPSLAARLRDLLDTDGQSTGGQWRNGQPLAFPGRLPDINASMALAQLTRLESFIEKRRAIASLYFDHLVDCRGLHLPIADPAHLYYRYIVRTVAPSETICMAMHQRGIDSRTSINPWLNDSVPTGAGYRGGPWPQAARLRDHLLSLPIYPEMTNEDVRYVAYTLREAVGSNVPES